eukprot:CAMPEP_0197643242 /NCGR_PEP_ID=MMETSP1338-20131121/16637_1 /TAXON_ID=43686 ORGANISM="Pelagodinium beii, Strain RCC1491" /NCGR_SAMPLE_ID=MMETSP1338 /ASSEMBLY_ACC=CAM_ASM_000754 /LENGTH=369 /DNA_ID=CAMNT_0043216479 /DNA_START=55 /DNA_END=1161 /DNA_ORIENTATION=-
MPSLTRSSLVVAVAGLSVISCTVQVFIVGSWNRSSLPTFHGRPSLTRPAKSCGADQSAFAGNLGSGFLAAVSSIAVLRMASSSYGRRRIVSRAVPQERVYSLADQVARFERAKKEKNERYLDINTVYDGSAFKGKTVLVVGSNKGLGLELVKLLQEEGAAVTGTCRKSTPEMEAVGMAQIITSVEVSDEASMNKMAKELRVSPDYVIFMAGYFPDIVDNLDSIQMAEAIKQIDICGLGPIRCVAALKAEGKLKGSKVVIISSQAGSTEWRFTQNKDEGGDYGHHMSRAACNIGAALMSEELKKDGVPVVMLHPGFNRTSMTAKYAHIWDIEGAVEPIDGAKRVLHEVKQISMETSGKFINCEDGLLIPW